uniref:Uncharacterized protein n=2 Tax=Pyrodinium bahamense TaxID=73915 RepID=A0A7S0FWY6_9DINO
MGVAGLLVSLRQASVIASSYVLFLVFVGLVWWTAWHLSLSKVPILRECFGSDPGATQRNTPEPGTSSATAGLNSGSAGASAGIALRRGPVTLIFSDIFTDREDSVLFFMR